MVVAHFIFKGEPEEILLFNNAGVIEPIHTVCSLDQTPAIRNIKVNLIAPILITNLFLNKALHTTTTKCNFGCCCPSYRRPECLLQLKSRGIVESGKVYHINDLLT
jgi:hypothetical protein